MKNDQLARVFKALSSPHRLAIFLRLGACGRDGNVCAPDSSGGDSCVGEVAAGLNLAPSTVSHHLKELREAGLIIMEKRGQKNFCFVDPELFEQLGGFFKAYSQPDASQTDNRISGVA